MGVVIPFDGTGSGRRASLDPLVALVQADMDRVNEAILARAQSHVDLIPELAGHLINSGGKRIRPMLTLAAARMCGYGGDLHLKLATAVEFMHTATLLHDDVVDESDLRRGKEAARVIWGNQASVLVGDYLLGQAFRMMVETGSLESLRILSNAACVIAEGEVLQLIDDALDYAGSEEKLGKGVGDDFRERKITLPVVLSYRRGSKEERSFWKRTLEDGSQTDDDLVYARKLMERHGALADTVERARHYGDIARDALAIFPETAWKAALLEAVDFCVSRAH